LRRFSSISPRSPPCPAEAAPWHAPAALRCGRVVACASK
jgi:hypothetical protein